MPTRSARCKSSGSASHLFYRQTGHRYDCIIQLLMTGTCLLVARDDLDVIQRSFVDRCRLGDASHEACRYYRDDTS
jgi:hypothetical protein